MNKNFLQKGIGIVEAIVAVAIVLIIFLGFTELSGFNLKAQQQNQAKIEAINLAAEIIEAVYSVKNADWDNNIAALTVGANYYPEISGNQWVLSAGQGSISGRYTRWVVFETAYRDGDDNISLAGPEDDQTRKLTAYVQWNDRGTSKQVNLVTYITNWSN